MTTNDHICLFFCCFVVVLFIRFESSGIGFSDEFKISFIAFVWNGLSLGRTCVSATKGVTFLIRILYIAKSETSVYTETTTSLRPLNPQRLLWVHMH